MDAACIDCGARVNRPGIRCKSCAARERWRIAKANGLVWGARYPEAICKRCGTSFRYGDKGRIAYCSPECRRNRVRKVCVGCGDPFEVPVSNAERYNHCSLACRQRTWPTADIECATCGTTFRATATQAKNGRRYCSMLCYRRSDAETSLERHVREVLEDMGVDFEQQAQIGRWVVDFLVGDLVIEADGAYWHNLGRDTDERKTAALEAAGYRVWRASEAEIAAPTFPGRVAGMRLAATLRRSATTRP